MEHEPKLTEQQRTALSQLESLRSELHSMVDARVGGCIQHILHGDVLDIAPTMPLTASSVAFKGKKPESVLFPDGREIKTPTWKTAVLAIMQDCNEDPVMHAPLEIDKDLYMESYYDTATLLYVLKNRVLDEVGYSYSGIHVRLRQEQMQEEAQEQISGMDKMTL